MKPRALILILFVVFAAAAAALTLRQREPAPTAVSRPTPAPQHQHTSPTRAEASRVPAHFETAPAASSLAPTLPPESFKGLTREAYRAVGEIPQTIAQLPCYCHCDEGFGHKSLQSCFVDDHAAHCAVCVEEALAAYRLQRQGLSAAQIRERIISEYANK
jgi:hypothetical protein